eukprot:jgi/Mesvir1/23413/Mv21104-RA.2
MVKSRALEAQLIAATAAERAALHFGSGDLEKCLESYMTSMAEAVRESMDAAAEGQGGTTASGEDFAGPVTPSSSSVGPATPSSDGGSSSSAAATKSAPKVARRTSSGRLTTPSQGARSSPGGAPEDRPPVYGLLPLALKFVQRGYQAETGGALQEALAMYEKALECYRLDLSAGTGAADGIRPTVLRSFQRTLERAEAIDKALRDHAAALAAAQQHHSKRNAIKELLRVSVPEKFGWLFSQFQQQEAAAAAAAGASAIASANANANASSGPPIASSQGNQPARDGQGGAAPGGPPPAPGPAHVSNTPRPVSAGTNPPGVTGDNGNAPRVPLSGIQAGLTASTGPQVTPPISGGLPAFPGGVGSAATGQPGAMVGDESAPFAPSAPLLAPGGLDVPSASGATGLEPGYDPGRGAVGLEASFRRILVMSGDGASMPSGEGSGGPAQSHFDSWAGFNMSLELADGDLGPSDISAGLAVHRSDSDGVMQYIKTAEGSAPLPPSHPGDPGEGMAGSGAGAAGSGLPSMGAGSGYSRQGGGGYSQGVGGYRQGAGAGGGGGGGVVGGQGVESDGYREVAEPRVCCICMDHMNNAVMVPCGHLCTCVECATLVRSCPLCRSGIQQVVRVYVT